jgi:hypothetical protein
MLNDPPPGGSVAVHGASFALALKAALAPVLARLELHTEKLAAIEPVLGTLRERLAVSEARPPVPGPPGPAGADGVSLDELIISQDPDDERIVTLGYQRGLQTKTLGTIRFTFPRFCGVYDDGRVYSPGDQVTLGGALWHCHATTRNRPGGAGDGWTLQVKKGQAVEGGGLKG